MHAEYIQPGLEQSLYHVQEEAAEVIVAIAKIHRFGLFNFDPSNKVPVSNLQHLRSELGDLVAAIARLEREIPQHALGKL